MGDAKSVLEAADLLSPPYHGVFAVVVADAPGLARHALADIEPILRARDIGSAWRLTPDMHVGIVSMRAAARVVQLVETLNARAVGRVGVSPPYRRLDQTPQALHLARIALEGAAPGTPAVTVFDDAPIPMLVVSAPSTAAKISRQILGPVLDLPDGERETLLTTVTTYFACDGSAAETGRRLHCHPNTVRYRLRRIEQLCGKSFDRRPDSAELYVALNAVQHLPGIAQAPLA